MPRRPDRRKTEDVPTDLAVFLQILRDVSSTGRSLSPKERHDLRDAGADAAQRSVGLRELIERHLAMTWRTWSTLPGVVTAANTDAIAQTGEAVLRAVNEAVGELTRGYEESQRWTVRREDVLRRAFVDDLLSGRDLGQLAERAERYGLRLAGRHVVAAARAVEPFLDDSPATSGVQFAMSLRFSSRHVLVAAREGLLVCVIPHDLAGAAEEFARQVGEAVARDSRWWVGLGRPQSGPGGAVRSFEQARNALDLAERLDLAEGLVKAADLLVYQVLLRDSAALGDLVTDVLDPLRRARGGAARLVETLDAYFASGRVTTATARALGIGVRTVTYRLDRVSELTGYRADDPAQGFTLQVAVLGARLLGWPRPPRAP